VLDKNDSMRIKAGKNVYCLPYCNASRQREGWKLIVNWSNVYCHVIRMAARKASYVFAFSAQTMEK
jgi:hypothetical protein